MYIEMKNARRNLLKQIGLGITSIGVEPINSFKRVFSELENDDEVIYLRSNENPYGLSPLARKTFIDNAAISNRYNWDLSAKLISILATKNNVKDGNILLGAGSTEILDLVARYVALERGNYIIPEPTYDYWTSVLDILGFEKKKIPLTYDKKIPLNEILGAINKETRLVYICNPNNPTGTICDRVELINFLTKIPSETIILMDEAYIDFTNQQSLASFVNDYPNLIITKTFSKIYGLAGARIGYGIANTKMINNLISIQSNTNNSVSVLSKLGALASLKDDKFITDCFSLNNEVRSYTIHELRKMNLKCIESTTNFLYFSLLNYSKDYFKQLEVNNIEGTRIYEENGKWTRITIGKMDEMKKFIKAIQ